MTVGTAAAGRGQPLWALGGLLLCWIGLRAALIELPSVPGLTGVSSPRFVGLVRSSERAQRAVQVKSANQGRGRLAALALPAAPAPPVRAELAPPEAAPLLPLPVRPLAQPTTRSRAAGHNLLWMAAMGAIPLLADVEEALAGTLAAEADPPRGKVTAPQRAPWSGDAWLAWRSDASGLVTPGPITPVYGRSQVGAVLRYELAPGAAHRPAAYVRAVSALEGRREHDIAAGLTVRPLARLPVTAHGELRLSRRGSDTMLRPAAFLSGGVEAAPLAAGITARGYAQAGYVGGRDATAFADGSLAAEKPVWRGPHALLTTGGGAWGGAQRGAARLDLGPTASLRFRLGDAIARLSADYRLRVAGNAEPASGAALTLSAGF